jgi:hypothetical protein
MPKYVVISKHPPNSCPSANAILRKRGEKLGADIPPLMQKHGIKAEVILHLDPGHKTLFVLDAPTSEAVRDMLYEGGLQQWNDFEFYMGSSLEWITNLVGKQPAIW